MDVEQWPDSGQQAGWCVSAPGTFSRFLPPIHRIVPDWERWWHTFHVYIDMFSLVYQRRRSEPFLCATLIRNFLRRETLTEAFAASLFSFNFSLAGPPLTLFIDLEHNWEHQSGGRKHFTTNNNLQNPFWQTDPFILKALFTLLWICDPLHQTCMRLALLWKEWANSMLIYRYNSALTGIALDYWTRLILRVHFQCIVHVPVFSQSISQFIQDVALSALHNKRH